MQKDQETLFQYCQKIVVFSQDGSKVLLCRRKGEEDYDGVYSFIGGKMEHKDATILESLKREKDEEVGKDFKVGIYQGFTTQDFFIKKSGHRMVLPHYYAVHISGDIQLNEEYDDYKWVSVNNLDECKNRIPTIDNVVEKLLVLKDKMQIESKNLVEI